MDEDSLVFIGTDRGIYNKDRSPSKAAESQTTNRKPSASQVLQTIEVSELLHSLAELDPEIQLLPYLGIWRPTMDTSTF